MSVRRSRSSVVSQTVFHPLILASQRDSTSSTSSSNRNSISARSKRDSGLYGVFETPIPLKQRPYSEADAMAPVYRLYPHQASKGRRELSYTANGTDNSYDYTEQQRASILSAERSLANLDGPFDQPAAEDLSYGDERLSSLPSVIASDFEQPSVSPVELDSEERPHSPTMSRRSAHEHLPARMSVNSRQIPKVQRAPPQARAHYQTAHLSSHDSEDNTSEYVYGAGDRSSGDSDYSQDTAATSYQTLPALQSKGPDNTDLQQLEPVLEDDPRSWDLVEPADESDSPAGVYALETRAEQMMSSEHLHTIFNDPRLLLRFTGYLNAYRPSSIAVLIYYLDALKAIRAINYANAIAEALEPIRGHDFTHEVAQPTTNAVLAEKAEKAFEILVREDLPAFIAHTWVQVVSLSISRRITGTMAPHLRDASEGLAEVFCLTDPSRTDKPIVFASEEFVRMTQYGMNYIIGRNCRFLQGPRTDASSIRRLREATAEGRETTQIFVNYRRDGTPFMNLLMIAPLMDSRGNVRYFLGAQVDVSNLIKECSNLEGLMHLVEREQDPESAAEEDEANKKDEFQELTEMFNGAELETVRKNGGRMHREYVDDSDRESVAGGKRRVLLKDSTHEVLEKHGASRAAINLAPTMREKVNGKLEGVYQHYLLIRPAPSLRILFTSPSLRVPGILQSPFLDRIGGSSRVRSDLRAALAEGRGVTAKIKWLTRADADGEGEGRARWIHCTPLVGHSGAVGVWMIVLVDEDGSAQATGRRFRNAPPVADNIGGKQWEGQPRTNRNLSASDAAHSASARHSKNSRPGSVLSGRSSHRDLPTANGDVSEFSFQLK